MQGKKLTDVEIVKAFECCYGEGDCKECPLYMLNGCGFELQAIDIITRQKAEIEKLHAVIDVVSDLMRPLPFETDYDKAIKQAKAEAYKEFAELSIKRICEQVSAPTPSESYIVEKCNQVIYKLFKELVGDDNVD